VSNGDPLLKFWDILAPSSRVKIGLIYHPKTLVKDYHLMLHNTPEWHRSHPDSHLSGIRGSFATARSAHKVKLATQLQFMVRLRISTVYLHCPICLPYHEGRFHLVFHNYHVVRHFALYDRQVLGLLLLLQFVCLRSSFMNTNRKHCNTFSILLITAKFILCNC
jgi:hypothetical protein